MRKHIHEVQHNHIQLITSKRRDRSQQFLSILGIVYFIIWEGIFLTEPIDLGLNQWSLIQILTFLALLIYPQIRKHLLYLRRHQAREYRVAGILRGGWQYAIIQALVKRKILSKQFFYHPPLIQPEIIDQYKENLLVIIQHWENLLLKQVGAHQRAIGRILYPVHIILLHEFGKSVIGLFLLHTEHICHCHLAAFQFQFPVH